MTTIAAVTAREVLDSRGNPTVEADVLLSDGALGRAAAPSGASTGAAEAVELRDGDSTRFGGMGVLGAVESVRGDIARSLVGRSPQDQTAIDELLIELDGTADKSRLGANALVAVSIAAAKAAAESDGVPLYRHIADGGPLTLPVPMFNILNGGKHAQDSTDIQEFMVVPAGFDTFSRSVRAGSEVFQSLKGVLNEGGHSANVGDEGGFAPRLGSDREALELVLRAIERAGYAPGEDCFIALDVAASELSRGDGEYSFPKEQRTLKSHELIDRYAGWVDEFPIVSIEDGMAEDDWAGWTAMTAALGSRVQQVGDDLYTTRPDFVRRGIDLKASNAVLIKLNQIGTLTETLTATNVAQDAGWGVVISHRSGETEDTTVADLAVGTAAGQIKAGAPSRGERTTKYNRLLRIEEELGDQAAYAGLDVYERFLR